MAKENLHEGRWEDVLPTLEDESFDLIYTDPPYGMEYNSNIPGSKEWNQSGISDSKFEDHLLNDVKGKVDWQNLAKEFFRLAKNDTFFFLHCNCEMMISGVINEFVKVGFHYKGTVVWNKGSVIGGDLKSAMMRDWEPVVYFKKGKRNFNPAEVKRKGKLVTRTRISETKDWVFTLKKHEKVGFPTQKPIALAKQIIELTTKVGDIVLDPFTGSGAIPLAAIGSNRGYVAVEVDDKWSSQLSERLGTELIVEESRKIFRNYIDDCRNDDDVTRDKVVNNWIRDFALDGTSEDVFYSRLDEIPSTKEWFFNDIPQ